MVFRYSETVRNAPQGFAVVALFAPHVFKMEPNKQVNNRLNSGYLSARKKAFFSHGNWSNIIAFYLQRSVIEWRTK